MKPTALTLLLPILVAACASASSAHAPEEIGKTDRSGSVGVTASSALALEQAVTGAGRDPADVARDTYRHPMQTLQFFGIAPDATVIEITPGGGWYAQILAPYLRDQGQYIAAVVDPAAMPAGPGRDYQQKSRTGLESTFAAAPARFDRARVIGYEPADPSFGAPGSADAVLTFRNVHNWRMGGQADAMFAGFFAVLKPGGTLGVVEHRADGEVATDDRSGYVGQTQVIAMAQAAGFVLDAQSEINANPRDPKDHPNGVWMLPPSNSHDAADDAKYQAIGESDRMTLRFRKPD